jgi:hypothetical protein
MGGHQPTQPNVHTQMWGALPYRNGRSTGVAWNAPQCQSGEALLFAPQPVAALGMTLVPQATPTTAANKVGDLVLVPPTGETGFAAANAIEPGALQGMSTTRTGRNGPKRGLPGQKFEPSLQKVQRRLKSEGADVGAVKRLGSEIFLDGKITKAALKADMTLEQRKERPGKQNYMLLVEVVPRPQGGVNHQCLLCPAWRRVQFKNREDTLRHLHKEHFGLSFDCARW